MQIRSATPADANLFARLNEHVHSLHVEHLPHFFKTPAPAESAALFREMLRKENARGFLAYAGDQPIGYILVFLRERAETPFSLAGRWLYIDQISVEPNWQGQGVGGALLGAALACARDAGIREIEVETWAFNHRAQAFFQSYGFQPKTERLWLQRNHGSK